jgi:hypothetical protein
MTADTGETIIWGLSPYRLKHRSQSFPSFFDDFMRRYYPGVSGDDFYDAFSHAVAAYEGQVH